MKKSCAFSEFRKLPSTRKFKTLPPGLRMTCRDQSCDCAPLRKAAVAKMFRGACTSDNPPSGDDDGPVAPPPPVKTKEEIKKEKELEALLKVREFNPIPGDKEIGMVPVFREEYVLREWVLVNTEGVEVDSRVFIEAVPEKSALSKRSRSSRAKKTVDLDALPSLVSIIEAENLHSTAKESRDGVKEMHARNLERQGLQDEFKALMADRKAQKFLAQGIVVKKKQTLQRVPKSHMPVACVVSQRR